ncbi:hypothetical protein GIY56_12640 [Paracoccus sp. YIM 132242]|uniref:Glycosyltransferase family 2 protein n=1 Tax=Paracoccus lichenicola TaxID=2665644 RepID=A0A6L6HPT0_9RHOB|nr:hypothetical protein [Paracoccus lichenicola]MTE01136.1 hypothetical protein [Paracoccus lichenicola]
MSPADGGFFGLAGDVALTPDLAIILPGGRTLLALSQLRDALPRRGFCNDAPWQALCWPVQDGRAGLALVEAPLVAAGWLRGPAGEELEIAPPRNIDVAPAPLAEFVRRIGLSRRQVSDFLIDTLIGPRDGRTQPGHRDFVASFLSLACETDGFVEILACPDTGGLFAQGWALSLAAGRHSLGRLTARLEFHDSDVAVFARQDIPAPGMGFCLFSLGCRGADLDALDCLFYEQDGTLKRLEIVRGTVLKLRGEAAADHVRQMLPRLAGDGKVMGIHRRICRPRYGGIDTLSLTPLPVAAAFDTVFEAPSGGLLATGWLLDPLRRVGRVIVKSTAGLYAPLHDRWNPLPRPDLNDGFANDPRFARLLDAADSMHGFMAFAPGKPRQGDEEFYLELVLDDGTCLFRPLTITRLDGRDLLPQILAAMPLHDPALDLIVKNTLAPFLAALPARPKNSRAAQRPLELSADAGEITAVIPLTRMDHLQPMMALLAGTSEADRLDLVIVMARAEAGRAATRLKDLFAFYGIRGRLLLVADQTSLCDRIEAGLSLAAGARVLIWSPLALPATPGWLGLLEAELAGLGTPGLISPTLVYEDGSIFYGGDGAADGGNPMLGYPRGWLTQGAPCPMPAGAAQLALIDREAMAEAGGFAGALYSDALLHRDLARRLHAAGFGTWSSRNVDFWTLEDPQGSPDAKTHLLETVDSALLVHTAAIEAGERF